MLDVDYSPTGREFVSGSYDKTVRIFPVNRGHSRYGCLEYWTILLFGPFHLTFFPEQEMVELNWATLI